MFRMNSRHSSGFTSVPVAIMSTVTAMRGLYVLRNSAREFFGLLAGALRRDLLAEVVALAELLADDPHDVLGVQVGLGEDQRLRNLGAAGEDFRQLVLERADHQPNLVLGHHVAVELIGGVGQVVVEFLVLLLLGAAVAVRHEDARLSDQLGPVLGDFGFDAVHVVADVDAIDDGLLVGVVLHQVAVEEADGLRASAWRSGR